MQFELLFFFFISESRSLVLETSPLFCYLRFVLAQILGLRLIGIVLIAIVHLELGNSSESVQLTTLVHMTVFI